jgi:integrase
MSRTARSGTRVTQGLAVVHPVIVHAARAPAAVRPLGPGQVDDPYPPLFREGSDRGHEDLVLRAGVPLDAANVRRAFRTVVAAAGMDAMSWTPRELRHSFVSLLSSSGTPIEDIAHLVGHANTRVTELVYRKELRPVLTRGAVAMDALFPQGRAGW